MLVAYDPYLSTLKVFDSQPMLQGVLHNNSFELVWL